MTHRKRTRLIQVLIIAIVATFLGTSLLAQFFPRPPRDPRPERAKIAFEAGRYEEVVDLLGPYLEDHPDNAEGWLYLGWSHYRLGEFFIATESFRNSLQVAPDSVDAIVGLGYATLQLDGAEAAASYFRRALDLQPSRGDALRGLILASRRADATDDLIREGAIASRRLETLEGGELEALMSSATLKPGVEKRFRNAVSGRELTHSWRAGADYLEQNENGEWRPLFVKGVNLGVALPGRLAYEFPNDQNVYRQWLKSISDTGFNAVRVSALLPPVFYEALHQHNKEEGERLWLIQGIWLDLPPDGDFASPAYLEEARKEIARTVDAVHGNVAIGPRQGKAWGSYRRDVSESLLVYIVGQSWPPHLVSSFNDENADLSSWSGEWFRVPSGNAMECWTARLLDSVAAHEARMYSVIRPQSFANAPSLDPLHHPSESTRAEENAWREHYGLPVPAVSGPVWNDDEVSVDATMIEATELNPAGLFASYAIYPAFPDFLNHGYGGEDGGSDSDRYARYLQDLKQYHADQPLMVIELGISTSRGIAHVAADGRHHGGHDEHEQGRLIAQMMSEVYEAKLAGGIVFELFDEWFRSTWNTATFELPVERSALWLNLESPQQSYGLFAAKPASRVITIDGDISDWSETPPYARD